MSAKLTGMVFDRYPTGGGELTLALAIADHAHDDGTHVFPSIARLAAKTRQSERTVQYQLRRMEALGWLLLENSGKGGRQHTREYRIHPEWIKGADFASLKNELNAEGKGADIAPFDRESEPVVKGANPAPFTGIKGANDDNKGCKMASERVQQLLHPNQKQPSVKATKSKYQSARERAQRPTTRFDEFWLSYPVKTAKPQCLRKWKASQLDALADVILADIAAKRVSDRRWLDGYIPNPNTYLNQERWNDPVQPVARGGPGEMSGMYSNHTTAHPGETHATSQPRESLVDRAARRLEEIGVLHQ